MKKLYLIRHAKASWDHPEQNDFDRTLTEQGEIDAHEMAKQLQESKIKPDLILSSSADRALKTAQIFAEELRYPIKNIATDAHIYTGGVEELVKVIKELKAKYDTVFLVGHNPSLTLLSHYLCEGLRLNLATCGVLSISYDMTKWDELVETDGQFLAYLHPHHELGEHRESHEQESGPTSAST